MSADANLNQAEPATDENDPPVSRRGWLYQAVTGFISTIILLIPGSLAGIFFLDPLIRKRGGSAAGSGLDGFIRLNVTKSLLPDDGTPVAVTIKDDLDDAWNRFPDVPVGSIWMRKNEAGEVIAFNSKCPHLGCSVDFRRSEKDFYCPCHTSSFGLDGGKTNEVPPRDMDTLNVVIASNGAADPEGDELWVEFKQFRGGTSEKEEV